MTSEPSSDGPYAVDVTPTKTCSKCGLEKPLSEYYESTGWKDGHYSWCKDCHRALTKARNKALGPRDRRIERIASMYRISRTVAAALVDAPRCQICGVTSKQRRLDVDHCHVTGKARGALCGRCNKGIAYFDATPEWLIKATAYVWPLSGADAGPLVDVISGSVEPGLWADRWSEDDSFVSHGEWSS